MKNILGLWSALVGLYGVVWAVSLSHRLSVGLAGAALTAACVLFAIDVEEWL